MASMNNRPGKNGSCSGPKPPMPRGKTPAKGLNVVAKR